MCGIAGIVHIDANVHQKSLRRMVSALKHRGPDDFGIQFFQKCGLGHSRLSIIDLFTGHQPMLSQDNKKAITFNGEIYDFQNIKSELSDYSFITTSDTEIILALYQKYDEYLLSHLPGMFAFAIWDNLQQKLFCARDRFGEKPFYYAFGKSGEFLFASEIKALLASNLITPIISRNSVIHYMKRLYIHPYKTIYENVYVLPPAHKLIYQNGNLKIERYWQLPESNDSIELSESVEIFKLLFEQAVKRQMIADVPIGAFLSGGLDSTSIVAIACKHNSNLKTYSFDLKGELSELHYARDVVNKFKTDHVELTNNNENIGDLLLKMQEIYDEPFADSSNIPTYLICNLARKYGKTILTGDGGDELMAGYSNWYIPLLYMESKYRLAIIQLILLKLVAKFSVIFNFQNHNKWKLKYIGHSYNYRYKSITQAHYSQNQYITENDMLNFGLITNNLKNNNQKWNWRESGTVDDALRMDIEDYMPGDILVKIDRASMANSLELRAPFLDVDLATFCLSLPSRLKIKKESDKLLLRNAYSQIWPNSILTRSKQGFGAPVTQWLKLESLRGLIEQYLKDPKKKVFELISFKQTRSIVNIDNYKKWILLVLSIWMEKNDFELG